MRRSLTALLPVLWLAACATPGPTPEPVWRAETLAALDDWQVRGKVALRDADRAESAQFQWQQRKGISELELSGPLGVGAVRLRADGKQLSVERDGERDLYPIDAEGGVAPGAGWGLPVSALPHWLRGLPLPDTPVSVERSEDGSPRVLEQLGWRVEYQRFERFDGVLAPSRISVSRGDTRARLLIREWDL